MELHDDIPVVSEEEILQRKQRIMIETIFNCFYTPFNTQLLINDLNTDIQAVEADLSVAVIEARRRLDNPEGSYFKRRDLKDNVMHELLNEFEKMLDEKIEKMLDKMLDKKTEKR